MTSDRSARCMAVACLWACLALCGCVSRGPSSIAHERLDPSSLNRGSIGAVAQGSEAAWPESRWWSDWGPADLSGLIDQALEGSPTMALATSRLQQAQATADAAGSLRSPRVNFNVDFLDTRFSENGLIAPSLAGRTRWSTSALLTGSWELDLFGRQRHAIDATLSARQASLADAQAARVLLATQVANGYVELARLIESHELAAQAVVLRERSLSLVKQRIAAGLDNRVDQRQAETAVAQAINERQVLEDAIARQRHALAELIGQGPASLDTLSPRLFPLRGQALPAHLPADLIGRRADLTAHRWRVQAGWEGVAASRAEFYPNVNLVAFAGLASLGLDRFLDLGSRTYAVGPALRLPVFDGGALRAGLRSKEAQANAAIDAYNATLLRALREVADEVGSLSSLRQQGGTQQQALQAAESAYALAMERYQAGLGNYLMVLTVESTVIAQRRAGIDLRAKALATELELIRALGGGFRDEPLAVSPEPDMIRTSKTHD